MCFWTWAIFQGGVQRGHQPVIILPPLSPPPSVATSQHSLPQISTGPSVMGRWGGSSDKIYETGPQKCEGKKKIENLSIQIFIISKDWRELRHFHKRVIGQLLLTGQHAKCPGTTYLFTQFYKPQLGTKWFRLSTTRLKETSSICFQIDGGRRPCQLLTCLSNTCANCHHLRC